MQSFWRIIVGFGLLATTAGATPPQPVPGVRLEIASRTVAFDGESFGDHGQYERISGIAHFRIDPRAPANRGIVDLANAPRDADGLVRYDSDFVILRPRDGQKASRVLAFDVVNRGIRTLSLINGGSIGLADPIDRGDALLMNAGITAVWNGWQGDVAGKIMIGARFPTVGAKGKPLTGRVATETIFDSSRGNRIALPYPAATLDPADAKLTVAAVTGAPARIIPPEQWQFAGDTAITLKRPADMDAGAIYRFEYMARDPKVMGLGFAATRDLVAFLRHGDAADGNPLADIAEAECPRTARGDCANSAGGIFASTIALGVSQSGRYLRDFVYQGFNRDLQGRRVFDGMLSIIPGGRRTFTNHRFAEPGRFSRQHEDHGVPGFTFPYAYATLSDPVTGAKDGILRACTTSRTCPLLFHIDTSAEFWQAGASLVGTGGTGRDVDFPPGVRGYMIAGGAHAPGMTFPGCLYAPNPMNYTPVHRALFMAMVDWTLGRADPPASRWPRLDRGELVPLDRLAFPAISLTAPKVLNRPVPPPGTPDWQMFVPAVDKDGNDVAGIRLPPIAAPVGTLVGWNLRKPGFAEGDLCSLAGSYLPFSTDRSGRGDDPRPSLAERYGEPSRRPVQVVRLVDQLVRDRLMLEADRATADRMISH